MPQGIVKGDRTKQTRYPAEGKNMVRKSSKSHGHCESGLESFTEVAKVHGTTTPLSFRKSSIFKHRNKVKKQQEHIGKARTQPEANQIQLNLEKAQHDVGQVMHELRSKRTAANTMSKYEQALNAIQSAQINFCPP
jgi:hypothetical protein